MIDESKLPRDAAAGVLFLHQDNGAWSVCLAVSRGKHSYGRWAGTGGSRRILESIVDTAIRETCEEWFRAPPYSDDLEAILRDYLPAGFHRSQLTPTDVHEDRYGDWAFYTFGIRLAKRFDCSLLRLDGAEFVPGSAEWFAVNDLPDLVKGNVLRALKYFKLLA